jgi:FixJ family two-component response regulator
MRIESMTSNPEQILVVDDEVALCQLMAAHLRRHGYRAQTANDGAQALHILQTESDIAILVTDLAMPNMGGLELLREARRLDARLEVIVISANDTVESAIAAMRENGAYDYLCKPLSPMSELSLAVGRAVQFRRLRLEREDLQARMVREAQRLQTLLAHTNDIILSGDNDDTLRVANPAAERLLDNTQLTGAPAAQSLPPQLARLLANWHVVGNHQPVVVEIPWSGNTTYLLNLTPILNAAQEREGWVMVLHDITHLKQLDELQIRLLTDTANRIQLPLIQSIATVAELSQMPEIALNSRATEIIYRLHKVLDRIRGWMEELLTTARIEAGLGLQPLTLNLPELVEQWIQSYHQQPEADPTIRLIAQVADDLPPVYADPNLVRRLLQQAVGQAIKQAGAGSEIALRLTCHEAQVWLDVVDQSSPEAEISGKSARSDARNRFRRTTQELNMVKAIVNRMGGEVWVRGQGTRQSALSICLPAISKPGEA